MTGPGTYIILTNSGWEVFDNPQAAARCHMLNVQSKTTSAMLEVVQVDTFLAPGHEMTDDWFTLCNEEQLD